MKKLGRLGSFLALLILLSLSYQSFATPVISLSNHNVTLGETFKAEVRVSGFVDLIGMQFSISWDSTILKYKGIGDFGMELNPSNNFGFPPSTNAGAVSFRWDDASVAGVTLADETVLFTIEFEAIGGSNTSTSLAFSDSPTQREVSDLSFAAIDADFIDGATTIDGISSTSNINRSIQVSYFSPNPFSNQTQLTIKIQHKTEATLTLIDSHGHELIREKRLFLPGEHRWKLDAQQLPHAGIYFYRIDTNNFTEINRLAFFAE